MFKNRLEKNIFLFYCIEFLTNFLFIIPVWVTFYTKFLNFTEIALLSSIGIGIGILLQLPTGVFADLYGRKTSIFLGSLLWGLGWMITGFAQGSMLIIIGILLARVGESFVSGADVALIYDLLKEKGEEVRFQKIRSISVLCMQFAIIIASIGAGFLYNLWNGLPFVLSGVMFFVSATLVLFLDEPQVQSKLLTVEFRHYVEKMKNGLQQLWKNTSTSYTSLFYICVGGLTWSWQTYFTQIYATNIGYSVFEKGILFAAIRFINVILIIRILRLDKYLSKKNIYIFFPVIILFSSFFTLIPSKVVGTILLLTMTLSSTLRFIVLDKYVNEHFESSHRATSLSALNMLVSTLNLIVVGISGPLLDRFPTSYTFVLMGIFAALTILPLGLKLSKRN